MKKISIKKVFLAFSLILAFSQAAAIAAPVSTNEESSSTPILRGEVACCGASGMRGREISRSPHWADLSTRKCLGYSIIYEKVCSRHPSTVIGTWTVNMSSCGGYH